MYLTGLATGFVAGSSNLADSFIGRSPSDEDEVFPLLEEVRGLVREGTIVDELADSDLEHGAIDGMLEVLDDDHTRYMPPIQADGERRALSGEYEGIGAEVDVVSGELVIVAPYDGSPAEEAGLRSGDVLLAADGVSLVGMSFEEAGNLVRGPSGSDVLLLIRRETEEIEISVTRGLISIPSVRSEVIEGEIGYLRLSRFAENSAELLKAELVSLRELGVTAIVLDLRQNPGGTLLSVIDVADEFIGKDILLTEKFGDGTEKTFESEDGDLGESFEIVVLVDGGSASASEVLAASLRESNGVLIVGQPTFGKGTVQSSYTLSNGGELRLTVARWLTKSGEWVHKVGIEPDLLVEAALEPVEKLEQDPQIAAAIEELR